MKNRILLAKSQNQSLLAIRHNTVKYNVVEADGIKKLSLRNNEVSFRKEFFEFSMGFIPTIGDMVSSPTIYRRRSETDYFGRVFLAKQETGIECPGLQSYEDAPNYHLLSLM